VGSLPTSAGTRTSLEDEHGFSLAAVFAGWAPKRTTGRACSRLAGRAMATQLKAQLDRHKVSGCEAYAAG
jgi:hypothetical protein